MTIDDGVSLLKKADNILILTHRRPDGDTIGSAAALCRALINMGKSAFVLENPEITPRFEPLLCGLTMGQGYSPFFVISCDVASDDLLQKDAGDYRDKIDICIDHHRTNTVSARNYIIEENSAACGEIVYGIVKAMGLPMDKKIAEAVYIAISTDTSCFKYSNTTARTLNIAAACYEAGINAAEINHEIFDSKTRARFDIERYVFENLRFYQDGKIALCTLPRQTIDNAEATEDDLENIAALPRQIKDVMIAITISETESGNSKVSVRTASGYDAASICSRFGGGGHERAAGGSLKGLPSANENTVLEAALQCIQE